MREHKPQGPQETFKAIIADLRAKAENAARRKKPTMWAYYTVMTDRLEAWFADCEPDDGGYAGAALALSQMAERECPTLPPQEAANVWAMGIYARRILKAWGTDVPYKPSLNWLRERAGIAS